MPEPTTPTDALQPCYRSGAVARMAGMPVATLRIWEQRYQAVRPTTAASGHRLYSAADVQRVLLLRQLTGQGHAIGAIAGLDWAQLQQVAQAAARAGQAARGGQAVGLRLLVVGEALAVRLQRPAVLQRLMRPLRVAAVAASLDGALVAPAASAAELLVWQSPSLPASVPAALTEAASAWGAHRVAVVYRFAAAESRKAFTSAGIAVLREPPDDEALGAWLASLHAGSDLPPAPPAAFAEPHGAIPPRRFDDAALTAIAGLSPNLACECPRHVAELLMQLASFEAYSAACLQRSPADAELHAYLQQVAGASRSQFESALERVARHEGLSLG